MRFALPRSSAISAERRKRLLSFILAAWLISMSLALSQAACAEDWPTRPVRIVNPLAPGGGIDILVRAVGKELTLEHGQPVIDENRAGGGGSLGAIAVAHAKPDGYTLLGASAGPLNVTPLITKDAGYDPVKDFTPLTQAAEAPIALVVNSSLPVHDVAEFLAYAKAHPAALSYGSSGHGSIPHLAGEYLKAVAGLKMVHVPFHGGSPAMMALLAGQIPVLFVSLSTALPFVAGGKIRVLGVVESHRSRSHPEFPTIGEVLPDYYLPPSWLGFVGPAGMKPRLVQEIYAALVKAIAAPSVHRVLEDASFEVVPSKSPSEFRQDIEDAVSRYRKIVAAANLEAQ